MTRLIGRWREQAIKEICEHIYALTGCGEDLLCDGMTDAGTREIMVDIQRHMMEIQNAIARWMAAHQSQERGGLVLLPPPDDEDLKG